MTSDSRDPGAPGDDDLPEMEPMPSDSHESGEQTGDFIDIETLGDETDFTESESAGDLAADSGERDNDSDTDDFDFQDDEKRGGGGFKKMLAPVLVLVIASGIGAYIVMNPGLLGGGNAPPPASVAEGGPNALPPGSGPAVSTASVQGTAPPADETEQPLDLNMPQPATNINEPPGSGPQDHAEQDQAGERALVAGLDDAPGQQGNTADITESAGAGPVPVMKEPPPMPPAGEIEEIKPVDITESVSSPAAPGDAALQDISGQPETSQKPVEVPVEDISAPPPMPGAHSAAQAPSPPPLDGVEVAAEEPAGAIPANEKLSGVSQSDLASAAPVQNIASPQQPSSVPGEMPAARPAPKQDQEKFPQVGAGMPVQQNGQASIDGAYIPPVAGDATVPAKLPPPGLGPPGPDVYFDSSDAQVPSGPLTEAVGPRKINPVQEPASAMVVVGQDYSADSVEAQIVSANRALKLARYDAAREMFEALYKKNNRDPRILMGRAVALQNSGMTESAIRAYDELLDIDHNNADALVNMLGLLRHQYPEVALRRLLDLHADYPGNAAIAAQVGITESDMGQIEDALRFLGIAISLEPQNAQHYFNMAVTYDRAKKRAEAIQYYQQALETDAAYGGSRSIPRDQIYDRLAVLRRR